MYAPVVLAALLVGAVVHCGAVDVELDCEAPGACPGCPASYICATSPDGCLCLDPGPPDPCAPKNCKRQCGDRMCTRSPSGCLCYDKPFDCGDCHHPFDCLPGTVSIRARASMQVLCFTGPRELTVHLRCYLGLLCVLLLVSSQAQALTLSLGNLNSRSGR